MTQKLIQEEFPKNSNYGGEKSIEEIPIIQEIIRLNRPTKKSAEDIKFTSNASL